ncbi:MAG TPA: MFS transporter [Sphingomonas sp.]|uniref:MFS transporter n=1 Tax=Sphingomonas sp. TaxID=28214 RepID=UPI002EDB181C
MGEVIADRRRRGAVFALGCLLLTAGVWLHLAMFLPELAAGRRLMAMAFDGAMRAGMALIAVGTLLAAGSLWQPAGTAAVDVRVVPPLRLTARHWTLIAVLVAVLVIDTMKPATLGFVVPGMVAEYGLPRATIAWLPFAALTGTAVGSLLWGWFADHQGRRAAILLSTLLFVGTSVCGAMPTLGWNIAMCFVMGASAGGLLPVAYALLTELLPIRRRGFFLVLVGGLGSAGGFFAASGLASVLEPIFGWRMLWLIGLPTGLFVLACSFRLPESPYHLIAQGRTAAARASLARYGGALTVEAAAPDRGRRDGGFGRHALPILVATGLIWGLVNFGFLLWLPAMLAASGLAVGASGQLLASAAFVAFLTILPATILYERIGGARAVMAAMALTLAGLLLVAVAGWVAGGALLVLVGVNAAIAMLLPFAAESSTAAMRGRATGLVAGASKAGGIAAQAAALSGFVPDPRGAALTLAVPLILLLAVMLHARFTLHAAGPAANRLSE